MDESMQQLVRAVAERADARQAVLDAVHVARQQGHSWSEVSVAVCLAGHEARRAVERDQLPSR